MNARKPFSPSVTDTLAAGSTIVGLSVMVILYGLLLRVLGPSNLGTWELNPDEGGNLGKALLVMRGSRLYREIWSDQPPVYTLLLSQWFRWFGPTLESARHLTLLCGALLAASISFLVSRTSGWVLAGMSTLLLIVSYGFSYYSSAAMVGIPALTFGALSLVAMTVARTQSNRWLAITTAVASGMLIGLGMLTKLYIVFLLPPLAIIPFVSSNTAPSSSLPSPPLLILGLITGLCLSITGIVVGGTPELITELVPQLITPHTHARSRHSFFGNQGSMVKALRRDRWLVLAAVISLMILATRRKQEALIPALWFASVCVLFASHAPLWDHYQPMLICPTVWIIALGIGETRQLLGAPSGTIRGRIGGIMLAIALGGIAVTYPSRILTTRAKPEKHGARRLDLTLLNHLATIAPHVSDIYSDAPLYPFLVGHTVPPHLAVCSLKRLLVRKDISLSHLQKGVLTTKPMAVLAYRYNFIPHPLPDTLAKQYQVIYKNRGTTLLVHPDLLSKIHKELP